MPPTRLENDLQHAVPVGLVLGEPLRHGEARGTHIFRAHDCRFDPHRPVPRQVRWLELSDFDASRIEEFKNRVTRLLDLLIPGVLQLREAGSLPGGEVVYLVEDCRGQRLSTWLKPEQPAGDWKLVRKAAYGLLLALEGLHRREIAHGDVRPANVFLDDSEGVLGNAATGGLSYWSNGKQVSSDESAFYWPPEWRDGSAAGHLHAPSKKADVYAAGLVVLEMCIGSNNNPWRAELRQGAPDTWTRVEPQLGEHDVPSDLRHLLRCLLADDPQQRLPIDATLQRFDSQLRRRDNYRHKLHESIVPETLLFAVLLFAGLWLWLWVENNGLASDNADLKVQITGLQTTVQARDQEVGSLKSDISGKEKDIESRDKRIAVYIGQIDEKNKHIKEQDEVITGLKPRGDKSTDGDGDRVEPDPKELAQQKWATLQFSSDPVSSAADLQRAKELGEQSDIDLKPKVKRHLQTYWQTLGDISEEYWVGRDAQFREHYIEARREPWQSVQTEKAKSRLSELKNVESKATATWKRWANSTMSVADLDRELAAQPEDEKKLLNAWLQSLRSAAGKAWTLQLKTGAAPAGYGVTREVTIYPGGVTLGLHNWSNPTSHTYADTDTNQIKFAWTPGESIQIILEGERGWWTAGARPNVIDRSFDGPLALWKLFEQGKITAGNFSLSFDVIDYPPERPRTLPILPK